MNVCSMNIFLCVQPCLYSNFYSHKREKLRKLPLRAHWEHSSDSGCMGVGGFLHAMLRTLEQPEEEAEEDV